MSRFFIRQGDFTAPFKAFPLGEGGPEGAG